MFESDINSIYWDIQNRRCQHFLLLNYDITISVQNADQYFTDQTSNTEKRFTGKLQIAIS